MEINEGIFKYFKENGNEWANQGTLNFDLYCCFVTRNPSKGEQFKITFNGNEREFWFKAKTPEEANEWINLINQHITASKGFKEQALAPKTKEFWKQEQISEKQFIERADTFDILLFKCNTSGGKLIRTYTGSEFDHAAMILKFGSEPDDVFFMEATGN